MKKVYALSAALLVAGCSTSSENISAAYVSPLQYQSYDCKQLTLEAHRVGQRMQEVSGIQDREATSDAVVMGVGLVLFWPALFFLADGGDREQEVARLKGEVEAVEQAAIQKECEALVQQIEQEREAARKRAEARKQKKADELYDE